MAPIIENPFRHTQDKYAYTSQASDLKGFVCVCVNYLVQACNGT